MIKKIFLSGIILFTYSFLSGQAIRSYTIELTCKARVYNSTQSILEFKWHYRSPNAISQYVYRKNKDRYDWGNPYRVLGNRDSSFNDTIQTGKVFEYMVEKDNGPDGIPVYGFIYASNKLPAITQRGKIILIVDSTNKSFLENDIRTYRNDLIGDGWITILKWVSPSTTVPQIKSYIVSQYNSDPTLVKSVVLIGDIAVPYSGNYEHYSIPPPDGHTRVAGFGPDSHEGAWPTDLYYGSMSPSTWKDSLVNNTYAKRPANRNVPNDGKFDVTELLNLVQLQVGRIDLSNMTLFKNDVPDTGHIERELLKRYFIKNHNFKHKLVTITERCLMDDNFGLVNSGYIEHFGSVSYRSMAGLIADTVVKNLDYRTELNTKDYLWSFGFGAGSYLNASGVASTSQLASTSQSIKSVFTGLFGSYFGDWDTANNFLRAPLAAKGNVLNSFWTGRPHWFFHHMGMGETIGYSALRTQNNYDSFWTANVGFTIPLYPTTYWTFNSFQVHSSLMGDPTVRMQVVEPAHFINARQDSCNYSFKISWQKSTDTAVHSYYVYRAKHIDSTFTQIGTTSNLFWKDNSPLSGENVYMVRALKLQLSGSGTYYNLSQGIFDTVSTSTFSLPIAQAGRDTSVCKNSKVKIGIHSNAIRSTYSWNLGAYTKDTVTITASSSNTWILSATDTLSTCIKRDTIIITALSLPVSENLLATNPNCLDTATWSSTNNNGPSFRYNWHFNYGTPSDTSGLGLINPGKVIYSNSGNILGTLIVVNPVSNCQHIDSQYVGINCVPLPIKSADINCMNTTTGKEINFVVYDNEQFLLYVLEGYNGREWKEISKIPVSTNRNYNVVIDGKDLYAEIRLKGKNGVNEMIDLGNCGGTQLMAEWEIYPNPVLDNLIVNYNGTNGNRKTEIELINSQGSQVMHQTNLINNGRIELKMHDLPAGFYTLRIKTGDKIEVFKVLKF